MLLKFVILDLQEMSQTMEKWLIMLPPGGIGLRNWYSVEMTMISQSMFGQSVALLPKWSMANLFLVGKMTSINST